MNGWIDARERLPADHKQKLVLVYNHFQQRIFYAVAYCINGDWNVRGGNVRYWRELPPMPEGVKK